MKLKLERPLCFFDLETTGINISEAKIISISILKLFEDGTTKGKSTLVNPTIPIPPEISLINGITDEMVKDKPTFKQISKGVYEFFKDCDIAGYNSNNFDNGILSEEFLRCDIDFPEANTKSIDVCNIFKKLEPRTLTAAVKFYLGKELEDAHNSEADTIACKDVFFAQLEKYDELKGLTVDELVEFSKADKRADFAGKLVWDIDGDMVYNFGKSRGEKVKNNAGFGNWMMNQPFITQNTKMVLKRELEKLANMQPF